MKTMILKNSAVFLAAATIISSCAALGHYKHVETVPEDLYGDAVLTDASTSLGDTQWQVLFSDPLLRNLIDSALVNNFDLKIAQERIEQAEAELMASRLAYIPTLAVNPTISASFPEGGGKLYSYNLAATSTWQMSFARLGNNVRLAAAGKEAAKDYSDAVRSRLIASVANMYYTLLMLDAEIATTTDMERSWAASVETAKALKEAGMADQVAVLQYEATLSKTSATLIELKDQLHKAENSMCLLLGSHSGTVIPRNNLASQETPEEIEPGIPVQMLVKRPDVRSAEHELEAAFYATRGAILNFFPTLSINGTIGLINPANGQMSPMSLLGNVGAGLVAPILNAGTNKAALRYAQSRQRETRLNFDKVLISAGNEVNDALTEYHNCARMENYYLASARDLDKAREDTEYLMKNSLDKSYLDVLFANNSFFEAELAAIANRTKKLQALVTLYSALGGGCTNQ